MKYALTIAEQGSMNKAAEQLFISQPSLTSAVRELEKEIGIQVFVRSSRGVSVTAEGADFLMYVRQVYQQYELLHQKYGGSGGAKRKFGVSTQHYSFAVKAFVEMVKNFGTLNFEFAIRETRTMDVLHDVGGFRSEVGIIYQCDYNRRIIGKMLHELELEFVPLIDCRAYVTCGRITRLRTRSLSGLSSSRITPAWCSSRATARADSLLRRYSPTTTIRASSGVPTALLSLISWWVSTDTHCAPA